MVKTEVSGLPGGESETTGWVLEAIYEHGLMENLSLGISVEYQSADTDDGTTTADYSGMGDIHVLLKGRHGLGAATFRFGADLQLSPGDAEVDVNGDASNVYSGQHSITPYVGVDFGGGPVTFGAKLSRGINLTDQVTSYDGGSPDDEESGGEATAFELFVEHRANFVLGGAFSYLTTADSEDQDGNTSEAVNPTMGLRVYGAFDVAENMTLLPRLDYIRLSDEQGGIDIKITGWVPAIALRATF